MSDVRLEMLKQEIGDSNLDSQTKAVLADDLQYAQKINGEEDPVKQGLKRIVISGIRRELLAHVRMERHVKDFHTFGFGKNFWMSLALQLPVLTLVVLILLRKTGWGWVLELFP